MDVQCRLQSTKGGEAKGTEKKKRSQNLSLKIITSYS
jgi:hypothetical protein